LFVPACQLTIESDTTDAGLGGDATEDTFEPPTVSFSWTELQTIYKMSPETIAPPTEPTNGVAQDPKAVQLGHFLFFDKSLSGDGTVACATCHQPDHGFADPEHLSSTSIGTTLRHTPTLLNVAYKHWYFWDGRSDSLWSQATIPMEAFNEMNITRLEIARLMADDPKLSQAYAGIFGALPDLSDAARFPDKARPVPEDPSHVYHQAWESMSEADQDTVNTIFSNVTKTIAAYELKLVSLDSPFDTYVEGLRTDDEEKQRALSYSAQKGLKLFLNEAHCDACHQQAMLTTNTFHNLGFEKPAWIAEPDLGRYTGTADLLAEPFNAVGEYSDETDGTAAVRLSSVQQLDKQKGQFRVPTLRNIALTAPYMHAGQLETLEDVVRFYSVLDQEPSVGKRDRKITRLDLSGDEIDNLVAFLNSLTGSGVADKYTKAAASPLVE
jgi:cytochrome c peroxidase